MVHGVEGPVLVHGNAGVEEHVIVVNEVGAPALVEEVHVLLQLVGGADGLEEVVHHAQLVVGECVGVFRVQGGEVAREQLVVLLAHVRHASRGVNVIEQQAVLHMPVGMAQDCLPLQLEEDDRDGLLKRAHGVVGAVGGLGEERELAQGDAIRSLEDLEGVVANVVANHRGEARGRSRGGAHPDDVMVAPLQVHRVVLHEAVEDLIGVGTAVKDVAHEVEVVDGEALDERGEAHDEVVRGAGVHNGVDDALVVALALLALAGGGMEELVDDVGVLDGHGLAHLGARVGVREVARQAHEPHEGDGVPFGGCRSRRFEPPQLAVGVVDEGAEVCLLVMGELKAEGCRHALSDDARAVVEDVLEGVILAVDVRDKVLGALGQVEDGLEVDDLGVGRLRRGELLREELEVLAVRHEVSLLAGFFT